MKTIRLRRISVLILLFAWLLPVGGSQAAGGFDVDDYTGQVVIVDFWASWCVPCRRSFPWMNSMHDKYADDGLVIIGINLDQEREAAEKFLKKYPPRFQIIYDETKDIARAFEVIAMPTSYLIGRDGKQLERHYGFKVKQQDEYEAAIVAALADKEW